MEIVINWVVVTVKRRVSVNKDLSLGQKIRNAIIVIKLVIFTKNCFKEEKKTKRESQRRSGVVSSSNYDRSEAYMLLNHVDDSIELNVTMKSSCIYRYLILVHLSCYVPYRLFENLHEFDLDSVVICNNIACKVLGIGDIFVKFDIYCAYFYKSHIYSWDHQEFDFSGWLEEIGLTDMCGSWFEGYTNFKFSNCFSK